MLRRVKLSDKLQRLYRISGRAGPLDTHGDSFVALERTLQVRALIQEHGEPSSLKEWALHRGLSNVNPLANLLNEVRPAGPA